MQSERGSYHGGFIVDEACLCQEFVVHNPMHIYLPIFIKQSQNANLHHLSSSHTSWKYFPLHYRALVLLYWLLLIEYCHPVLSKSVDFSHKLYISVSSTYNNHTGSNLEIWEARIHKLFTGIPLLGQFVTTKWVYTMITSHVVLLYLLCVFILLSYRIVNKLYCW